MARAGTATALYAQEETGRRRGRDEAGIAATVGPFHAAPAFRAYTFIVSLPTLGSSQLAAEPQLSQKAREQIPDLSAEVSSLLSQPSFQPFGQEDAQVLALAQWFKGDYMKWADPIPCSACQGKTKGVGSAEPTFSERGNGGGRVELHRCEGCGNVERFVRYGEPLTLMRERRGRCGKSHSLVR